MITKSQKADLIKDISQSVKNAKAFFLVDYKGLKVEHITGLRKKLFTIKGEMKVSRNTLAKRALSENGIQDDTIMSALVGTNAFVFAFQDPAAVAKTIYDYSKENENLKVKTGYMDGKSMSVNQVNFLATLPAKEVLQAQLLGVLSAPASKLARTLNEVPASLARVLNARTQKSEA
jgi:large subunit ribosomal protein L10